MGAPRRSAGRGGRREVFPRLGAMTHLLPPGQDGCAEPLRSVGIVRPPRGRRERETDPRAVPAESWAHG